MSWQLVLIILLAIAPLQLFCSLLGQIKAVASYILALIFLVAVIVCAVCLAVLEGANTLTCIVLLIVCSIGLVTSLILGVIFGRWLKNRKA